MDQRPYRLRSERLAQAVKLDRYKELMPGTEERASTHVVVSGEAADTIESPWGLSSSPHFGTINQQTNPPLNPNLPVSPSLPSLSVLPSLSHVQNYTIGHKTCHVIFHYKFRISWWIFYNSCTNENTKEHSLRSYNNRPVIFNPFAAFPAGYFRQRN